MKQIIVLYDIQNIHLIVKKNTGVTYLNQVGGEICYQAEMEGVLVPLSIDESDADKITEHKFKQGGIGISLSDADIIDKILSSNPSTKFISVDKSKLQESFEAWVYVILSEEVKSEFNESTVLTHFAPVYGFQEYHGVITWSNSD